MLEYNDVKKYDIVLCDIFDTFILRNVSPEYVKKIWCNHIVKIFELPINMIDLYEFRNRIETNLCSENLNLGFDAEFKYKDLIYKIYNNYRKYLSHINYEKFEKICIKSELEIEKKVQKIDIDVINVLKKCKSNGKKIYCVSDMYLSKDMINEIFNFHNIKDIFDDVFISCDFLKNKKSGELYNLVLKEIKISKDKVIMIGDNIYSDYTIPKNLGIDAINIKRENIYDFYKSFDANINFETIYQKFKKLSLTKNENFEHIIFSLYSFIEKLYFDLLKNNQEEVIFLSREGEFLKKLFDIYVSKISNKSIESKYAIVSRKSTYLPSLKNIKEENFSTLLKQYSYISVKDFLRSLNFDENEISEVIKIVIDKPKENLKKEYLLNKKEVKKISEILTLDSNIKVAFFDKSNVYKRLTKNEKFVEIFEKKRVDQKQKFRDYFNQITSSKNVALVDIGWNGSIQDNIQRILGKDYNITGYYLGLQKRDNIYEKTKKGLIFSNVPQKSCNFKLYSTNRSIYEILLGASHGSANNYVEKDGLVVPALFSKKEERDIYENCISKIQKDMLEVFSNLCDLFSNGFYNNLMYQKLFNKIHFNMMFSPKKEQIKFFNSVYHYENFGVFEFTSFNSTKKIGLKRKIKEYLKFFLKFNSYFYDTFWPTLKLYDNNMKFGMVIYKNMKRIQFLLKKII